LANWDIRALSRQDEPQLTRFSCGREDYHDELNEFLAHEALHFHEVGAMAVRVAVSDVGEIGGYYGLYAGAFRPPRDFLDHFPHKIPALPAFTRGRLAVSEQHAGSGLGMRLMDHALAVALDASVRVGATVIKLEAYEKSATFYQTKYGFSYVSKTPKWPESTSVQVMYLPLALLKT
jgi:GNAT superfamily N-acetyltransferase